MFFKQFCLLAALALAAGGPTQALAQPAIGASVQIGQPGFYGRLDIGSAPPPQLIYQQPIIVRPPPVVLSRAPIYLRVPPGHAKNWRKYCARYGACGQPVYLVDDRWYREVYAPYRREHYRHGSLNDGERRRPKNKDKHDRYREHGEKHRGKGHGKHRD